MIILPTVLDLQFLGVVAAGALAGAGAALLVTGGPRVSAGLRRRSEAAAGALGRDLLIAGAVAVAVLAVTRWPALAAAGAALVLLRGRLFGGAQAERHAIDQLEGLAAWTESLRDTIAGSVGLEQAIPASIRAAQPSVAAPLRLMSDRVAVRVPLPEALLRLADDFDDGAADLVVAALVMNARLRGPGLRKVLSSLAVSLREELEARRRVMAGRASTRRSVQIVVGVSVAFVVGLRLLNPVYVEPYGTPVGQLVLVAIIGIFAASFIWMRSITTYAPRPRILGDAPVLEAGR